MQSAWLMSPEVTADDVKSSWEAIGRLYDRSIESRVRCAGSGSPVLHQVCSLWQCLRRQQVTQGTQATFHNTVLGTGMLQHTSGLSLSRCPGGPDSTCGTALGRRRRVRARRVLPAGPHQRASRAWPMRWTPRLRTLRWRCRGWARSQSVKFAANVKP